MELAPLKLRSCCFSRAKCCHPSFKCGIDDSGLGMVTSLVCDLSGLIIFKTITAIMRKRVVLLIVLIIFTKG